MKRRRNPPHVHEYDNQYETKVYYLRLPGRKKVRLRIPGGVLPWSPTFMAIYEEALAEMPSLPGIGASRTVPGTVNAALVGYYSSPAFTKGLATSTQQNRRAILEHFREAHGDKRIALMHTQALQNIVNTKTPAAARNFRRAMRGFVDFCMAHHVMRADPLAGLKLPKMARTSGFHTWTEDEIEQFKARHLPGSNARLALELLLQTGHARADVVRMGRQHVNKSGTLSMRRQKTNVPFDIPLLPDLLAELERHPRTEQLLFLTTEHAGKPFKSAASFGNQFKRWCYMANLPHCSAHGLRKAAAVRHALNNATAPELMAWFGWKTIGEAQRYIEEANRIRLAASAGAKMRTGIGSPSNPVSQIEAQPPEKTGAGH
jgi:integrase